VKQSYILTYASEGGRTRQIRVADPDDSLSDSTISAAANEILDSGVFTTKSGALCGLKKVELQTIARVKVI
jgi:hypothetical protein